PALHDPTVPPPSHCSTVLLFYCCDAVTPISSPKASMFSLQHPLVLASKSPRRRQILEMLGFTFTVDAEDIDETPPTGVPASRIPALLAQQKTAVISSRMPDALVLGSDTLVEIDGEVLGKPADEQEG